jgi:Spy/CpxP family protein refolding chaperone
MKTLIVALAAAGALTAALAPAAASARPWHHHGHRVCSFHHHHRVCGWR